MDGLRADLVSVARTALPQPGTAALNSRQHGLLSQVARSLAGVGHHDDPLLIAEEMRSARSGFDALLGRTTTEDMLDSLFGRFCIGK
jgi:tRNA modification GTPase